MPIPLLSTLKVIQQLYLSAGGGAGRQSAPGCGNSSSSDRHQFHAWCGEPAPSTQQVLCHNVLELDEVLLQVLKHLDSHTLVMSIPLVCQQWRACAASEQLWAVRCDAQLLLAAAAAAAAPHRQGQLPLLHYAVYACNLLRNPLFLAADNRSLRRRRSRPHHQTLLTTEQRKSAWVTTVGAPAWEVQQLAGAHQPPLPLLYPGSSSGGGSTSSSSGGSSTSRLHTQLQEWLFGRSSSSSSSGGGGCSDAGDAGCPGPAAAGSQDQASTTTATTSYLATGSSWAEVVQVVDLLGELTARGLDHDTAAAVLDTAGLAIALSFWVAAEPDSSNAAACDTHSASGGGGTTTPAAAPSGSGGAARQQQSPAQFAAALMLDGGQVPLRSFQTFVSSERSHHFFSKRLAVDVADGWRRFAYVLQSCPKGARRAVVLLRGRGPGPGSSAAAAAVAAASNANGSGGGGGVRFACAQLAFIRQDDVEAFGADECLAAWQEDRVVHGF